MNEQNLIPINTRADFKAISSKGGKRSGEVRKELAETKEKMGKALRLMLVYDQDIDTLLYWERTGAVDKLRKLSALSYSLGYASLSEMLDDQLEQAQKKYEAKNGHRMEFKPRLKDVGPWPEQLMEIAQDMDPYEKIDLGF